eukprot:1283293-Rhodomonas_salina.1
MRGNTEQRFDYGPRPPHSTNDRRSCYKMAKKGARDVQSLKGDSPEMCGIPPKCAVWPYNPAWVLC